MRIWDIPPNKLCRNHLLGEHRELHAIWSVLTNGKKGYARDPETLRWKGKLKALFYRHEALTQEMGVRGFRHFSPLAEKHATGQRRQRMYVDSPRQQIMMLKKKRCHCDV